MEEKQFIAVKANKDYVGGYNIKLFKEIKNSKILCWNKSETEIQEFDFYQEFPPDNRHPYFDAWRDAKGNIVTWDFMEGQNTYPAITLADDSGVEPDEDGHYPFDTWLDKQENLVCYQSDVKKYLKELG